MEPQTLADRAPLLHNCAVLTAHPCPHHLSPNMHDLDHWQVGFGDVVPQTLVEVIVVIIVEVIGVLFFGLLISSIRWVRAASHLARSTANFSCRRQSDSCGFPAPAALLGPQHTGLGTGALHLVRPSSAALQRAAAAGQPQRAAGAPVPVQDAGKCFSPASKWTGLLQHEPPPNLVPGCHSTTCISVVRTARYRAHHLLCRARHGRVVFWLLTALRGKPLQLQSVESWMQKQNLPRKLQRRIKTFYAEVSALRLPRLPGWQLLRLQSSDLRLPLLLSLLPPHDVHQLW